MVGRRRTENRETEMHCFETQHKEKKRTNYILLKHSSYGEIAEKERDL